MLTLSDRWFTTQTSPSLRAATATGSSPTGTEPSCVRLPSTATAKISSRSSGVFSAKSRSPSGESASGRTCPLSKVTNSARAGGGPARTKSRCAAKAAMEARRQTACGCTRSPCGNGT